MPSGSKKRKAAKKKKEQLVVNPQENDERDSNGSPASQGDHNHQHPFNHRQEERKRAPSPVESHEEKSMEETLRDSKHAEHNKSSSCSGSSDDESRVSEKKSKEEAYNLGSEDTSCANKDDSATITSMKVAENGTHRNVNANSANFTNKSVYNVVESRSQESEVELLPPSNGISRVELEGNEVEVSPYSSTSPAETSNVAEKTRDAEPHDDSKMHPLVASTPPTVQRTLLFSCCGLFDVLTSSNR
ncbi:uncharacterized protein LOC120170829 [Hibiscus syriacus]|uniref:uncharacterized protein LOC120170829 n=1 Tax=Hibiscus syriacus TaxID=106335 RepID=UPI00192107C5|nr:uncharacterized protein LOC120170829 [Hibiscus syriacus]